MIPIPANPIPASRDAFLVDLGSFAQKKSNTSGMIKDVRSVTNHNFKFLQKTGPLPGLREEGLCWQELSDNLLGVVNTMTDLSDSVRSNFSKNLVLHRKLRTLQTLVRKVMDQCEEAAQEDNVAAGHSLAVALRSLHDTLGEFLFLIEKAGFHPSVSPGSDGGQSIISAGTALLSSLSTCLVLYFVPSTDYKVEKEVVSAILVLLAMGLLIVTLRTQRAAKAKKTREMVYHDLQTYLRILGTMARDYEKSLPACGASVSAAKSAPVGVFAPRYYQGRFRLGSSPAINSPAIRSNFGGLERSSSLGLEMLASASVLCPTRAQSKKEDIGKKSAEV